MQGYGREERSLYRSLLEPNPMWNSTERKNQTKEGGPILASGQGSAMLGGPPSPPSSLRPAQPTAGQAACSLDLPRQQEVCRWMDEQLLKTVLQLFARGHFSSLSRGHHPWAVKMTWPCGTVLWCLFFPCTHFHFLLHRMKLTFSRRLDFPKPRFLVPSSPSMGLS